MTKFLQTLAVLLAIIFCYAGCASDSESPAPIHVVPVSPGVGSSFLYYALTLDSTGAITKVDSSMLYGDTVLAVGLSQFGKTNVTQFTPNFLYQYVNYESDGDISYYMNPGTGQMGTWITVPLDSMGTRASVDPNPANSTWYTYTGQDPLNFIGQQFNSESFNIYSGSTTVGIQGISSIQWYDTTTGIILEQNTLATRDSVGQFGAGSGYEIAKFTVK